jgi:hypothetical protein
MSTEHQAHPANVDQRAPALAPVPLLGGFSPSELLADYHEWEKGSRQAEPTLRPETKNWLYAWRMWDLACSPMDDNDRRRTRYGHYLGWHHALRA